MWKLINGVILTLGLVTTAVPDEAPAKPKPKPQMSVEFCGRLRHGVMAIGGESTGTNISFDRIIWELQLLNDADRKFAQQHHKKKVVVTGRLRKVKGIETKDRWIIDVTKLSEQNVAKDKEGVRVNILGTLQTSDSRNGKPTSMAINSAGIVWPVDVASDRKLKIAAETMIGQRILLSGSLKPETRQSSETVPTIQVTNLKLPPEPPAVGQESGPN